ncbi:MAG: hypothetical protein ACI9DH_000707 [Halioglobus sp.]|jgi:hypothetical protein
MKTEVVFSDSICPLCSGENQCAMSADNKIGECWCKSANIDAEALKNIPAQLQGKVCICQACANPKGKVSER